MQKEKRQRAPNGYRIERWADGIYHVYCGGSCIEETFTRRKAVIVAKRHAAEQSVQLTGLRRCHACKSLLEEHSVYCDNCGTDTPRN